MEEYYEEVLPLDRPMLMPVWKFALLSLFSFGIYNVIWFYKSWRYFKYKQDLEIQPVWRAIFSIIFVFSLSNKLAGLVGAKRKESLGGTAIVMGILYVVLSLSYKLPDPYWSICLFSFLPLITLVNYQNEYLQQEYEGIEEDNSLNWWEIAILVVGGILMFATVEGIFFPYE